MQVALSVSVGLPAVHNPADCPFCQKDEPETDDKKTIYEGKSGDLARALEEAQSPSPQRNWVVSWNSSELQSVPNAHHLIPAEEALHGEDGHSDHPSGKVLNNPHLILRYMSADADDSKVKSDIGYNVNAAHNGIWLPSVPVQAKEKKEKDPQTGKMVPAATQVDGYIGKWSGLSKSKQQSIGQLFMREEKASSANYGKQWHQRHAGYSRRVEKWLNKFVQKLEGWKLQEKCPVCKAESDDTLLPPPMGLLARLRGTSLELRGYLRGTAETWEPPMFASTIARKFHKSLTG